jgi:hypothetical protein
MEITVVIKAATAKGIDLSHIGGIASNLDGIAARRKLTRAEIKSRREDKLGLDVRDTVRGRESRTYRQPAWTVAELGRAAQGLGPIPWNAALYSFAGAREGYWLLHYALKGEAHRLARRECWAMHVPRENGERRFFNEDLAELVLIEDANKHVFAVAPQLCAIAMDVSEATWKHQLNEPFCSLKASYGRWLDTARGVIGRWVRASTDR